MDTYKLFTYKNIQKTLLYPRLKVSLSEWYSGHLYLCLKPKALTWTIRAAIFWMCPSLHHHQPQIHVPLASVNLGCLQHTTYPVSLPLIQYLFVPKCLHNSYSSFPAQICCHILGRACYKKLGHPDIYHFLATTHQSDHSLSLCVNQCGHLISSCLSKYIMGKIHNSFVHSSV